MKSTPRSNTIRRAHHQQPAPHAMLGRPPRHRQVAATAATSPHAASWSPHVASTTATSPPPPPGRLMPRHVASCRLNHRQIASTAAMSPHAEPHRRMPPQPPPDRLMPPHAASPAAAPPPCRRNLALPLKIQPHSKKSCRSRNARKILLSAASRKIQEILDREKNPTQHGPPRSEKS